MEHLKSTLTFQFGDVANDEVFIKDTKENKNYIPKINNRSKDITKDYARITLTHNPFQKNKKLLMIVGSYGYGSWGGVRYVLSEEFLNHNLAVKTVHF